MTVILASQSPRRQELLKRIIPEFEIVPADIDETIKEFVSPEDYVLSMALQKAEHVAQAYPNDVVIGCDTIVTIDGEILGKPTSYEDAHSMLEQLNGRSHMVYTSIAIIGDDRTATATVPAEVKFFDLSEKEILTYLNTEEYVDKAGAYGIQGHGALLVQSINGDYYSIVGFPIAVVSRMLQAFL